MVFHVLNRGNHRMPIFEQYEYWTYPLFFPIPFSFRFSPKQSRRTAAARQARARQKKADSPQL